MKFDEIVDHLGKRGFVTRKLWKDKCVVFFGMDNIGWFIYKDKRSKNRWTLNLAEIKADDWILLPFFWDGGKDDYLPYENSSKDVRSSSLLTC